MTLAETNGRVEYILRPLEPGVRHAFTVLTSSDVLNTAEQISGTYRWPSSPPLAVPYGRALTFAKMAFG